MVVEDTMEGVARDCQVDYRGGKEASEVAVTAAKGVAREGASMGEAVMEAERAWVVVVVEEVPEGDGVVEEERGRVPRVGAVKVVAVTEAET